MIADDDETSYYYLYEVLMELQMKILYAKNGNEVIELMNKENDIKLILMDLKMPGLNGLDTTREIRKSNKNIPIIVQTAYASDEERDSAIQAGCSDFITKPINKKELLSKINNALK